MAMVIARPMTMFYQGPFNKLGGQLVSDTRRFIFSINEQSYEHINLPFACNLRFAVSNNFIWPLEQSNCLCIADPLKSQKGFPYLCSGLSKNLLLNAAIFSHKICFTMSHFSNILCIVLK